MPCGHTSFSVQHSSLPRQSKGRRTTMTKFFTLGIELAIVIFIVGSVLMAGHM
jgi:hypothetical protein